MRKGLLIALALGLAAAPASASAIRPEPSLSEGSLSLKKTTLAISYNPHHKQADWVFYPLGPDQLRNCVNRAKNFRADESLTRETRAELSDYAGSGYDRGHLSPAADNKFSGAAMSESFLLSNISPQPPGFNQGIWARLENLVRAWALKFGGLYVATGPVLKNHLPVIGRGRVSVPEAYYKVLVTQDESRALALLLPVNASGDLQAYVTTVDEVERLTGTDFNRGVRNEEKLESETHPDDWNFRASYQPLPCQR